MFSLRRILKSSENSSFHVIENGRLGVVRLSRTKARNAISIDMCETIVRASSEVRNSHKIRALIVTGDESSFSAGRDLKASLTHSQDEAHVYLKQALESAKALLLTPVPVIASIERICLGLGFELALAADIRVAGRSTQLGFPEINLSLFPGCGGAVMLPALTGNVALAEDLIFTGRRVSAEEALRANLVTRVVDDGQAFNESLSIAKHLVDKNRELLVKTKQVVKRDFNEKVNSDWWSVAEKLRREVGDHPDHLAALKQFSTRKS
jgi:enoyl-CoA hydratase/carnithine racemase